MDIAAFYHSEIFKFVLLPVLIFLARICDVTLDTLRIIYVGRGMKFLAPVIGFVEVMIWLVAITQIFKNLSSPVRRYFPAMISRPCEWRASFHT